jgi:hypothetical protein
MKRKVWATMTECFELIDRKLLKGPWVMGEQYTICDPRMAAGYSADEKAKLLSGTAKREFHRFQPRSPRSVVETAVIIRALRALDPPVGHESAGKSRNRADDTFSAILRWFTQALSAGFRRALGAAQILARAAISLTKSGMTGRASVRDFVRERRSHVTPGLPPLANLHSQRWHSPPKIRFAPDSPLEQTGFEPSVPLGGRCGSRRS